MSQARGFLGAGDVYISRFDPATQAFLPYQGPYENTKFEVKAITKLVEQTSRSKTRYGQSLEAVALPQPSEFALEVAEVNRESLALAVLGTVATYTQAGATVTNEAIVVDLGEWQPLANASVSAVVVTNSAGTVTYVAGTDYEVNATLGWVRALAGGAIADSSTIHVDYTAAAVSGHRIRGATNPQMRAKIMFDGVNLADNSPCIVDVYEAVISSSAAFDFMADKFNAVPLTGRLKTPTGKNEPFEIRLPQG